MRSWILLVVALFGLSLARSRHCLDDFDLPDGPLQKYSYKIPHGDEVGYWARIEKDATGQDRRVAFSRSFYIFGRFGESESSAEGEDTTITAGLYKDDELIYKTVINCNQGSWENWILNQDGKEERILRGTLDKECQPDKDFDLIMKNDNFHLANWIFNAQPLQHEVKVFARKTNKMMRNPITGKTEHVMIEDVKRPAVKILSKYGIYNATHFRFEATGSALFTRLAFGPCTAWPDKMDSECQLAREWVHSRSKANLTDETLAQLKTSADANFTRGLGVFGNNIINFNPLCLSRKYFHWIQQTMHPDSEVPLYNSAQSGVGTPNFNRAYCCCTDMRTGRIFGDNPERNCQLLKDCITYYPDCNHAFDAEIGKEVFEDMGTEEESI